MTVYLPDSPGDCPTGINCSVISCAEGAGGPPTRSALIPTSATTNLRMVIRSPSRPSFDEERSRLLLFSDGLLRVLPSEECTPAGLVQRAAGWGIVERLAVVEGDRAFDGFDRVVVEEGPGVRRLHQRRNVEGAVARRAEPVVTRDPLACQTSGLIGQILHTGVEVGIPEAAPTREVGRRPRVHMADIALAERVVEEDLLPSLGHRALEPEGQREVLLPPQGQLERLQGVELLIRGQAKVDARNPMQGLGEMLNHRAGREGPE